MPGLIVSADDFGLTDGVSRGIVSALEDGIVTATSGMVCCDDGADTLRRWLPAAGARVGLHLQLTDGIPRLDPASVPSLVATNGRFPRGRRRLGRPDPEETRREWTAQILRAEALGLAATHLDSHHHVHGRPELSGVFVELAASLGVPGRAVGHCTKERMRAARVPCADLCDTRWYGGPYHVEGLVRLVKSAFRLYPDDDAVVELMCHPGRADEALSRQSTYLEERELELDVLRSPCLSDRLVATGVDLVGMAVLNERGG